MIRLRPNSADGKLLGSDSGPSREPDTSVISGAEVLGGTPVRRNDQPGAVVSILFETVWAWIVGIRMRLKIKRDLGRRPTEPDLTSIDAWMKVDEAEQREKLRNSLKTD